MKRSVFTLALVVAQTVFGAGTTTPTKTPMERLTIRLRQQNIQIQRDEKAGKLTKAQAKALKGQVEFKNIHAAVFALWGLGFGHVFWR